MRGIVSWGAYLPQRRLEGGEITAFFGSGGGKGSRAVASHDEDTTTMAAEALLKALESAGDASAGLVGSLHFSTATPAYADKTNACVLHAVAGLDRSVAAYDEGGSLRSGIGVLKGALCGRGGSSADRAGVERPGVDRAGLDRPGVDAPPLDRPPLDRPLTAVAMSDMRDGLPTSPDECLGGDGAAAFLIADSPAGGGSGAPPLVAEYLGGASTTEEFLDRWRAPGDRRPRTWEERFGETRYLELGHEAWTSALGSVGIDPADVSAVAVTGMHGRAAAGVAKKLGVAVEDLSARIGRAGCAEPGIALARLLEKASPGDVVGVVHLADGADVLLFRVTPEAAQYRPARSVDDQLESSSPLPYAKFLAWRQMLTPEPPRRPEPARVSSSAAWRSNSWKYSFTGSADRSSGAVHLPPARVSMVGGAFDEMSPAPRARSRGKVATFTVDRLAYSPSPPIVFAVVDFAEGGRFPLELTDCDETEVSMGTEIEMTFRRLHSADGIHDYFWKGRPVRPAVRTPAGSPDNPPPTEKGGS